MDMSRHFLHELKVDHGITQPLQLMNLEDVPLVPIVVNAAASPLPTPARCHAFGAAVGRAVRNAPQNLRVAVLASGGLSHDPPKPSEENRLHGRTNGFAASREREARLISNATVLQSRINPEWDRMVLDHFIGGEAGTLAAKLTTESIYAAAGNGGQEIRTWFAAAGALNDTRIDLFRRADRRTDHGHGSDRHIMRIGFAGIGRMGEPMAFRLLNAKFPLMVWNRNREKLSAITAAGARAAVTPRQLAAESDAVLTMVTDDAAVESIYLGSDGLLSAP